ncbi:MAG: hypothetical protein SNF33_03370 [Candidatus Algichlamydia australiensis]|nr:hypothetical protein [Chlamydiales bacterium]
MSTQVQPQAVSTQENGNAIDNLWSLTTATASGTYLIAVLAVAASMTAVNNSIDTYVNQLGVLMQFSHSLMQKMEDESNAHISTRDEYTTLTSQTGYNQLSTQLISNCASELSTYISSGSQLLLGEKTVGNSIIKMYDQTTGVR